MPFGKHSNGTSCEGTQLAIALLVFSCISIGLALAHEPWRDEAQAWLIARDTPDFFSMLKMGGYEGTPMLWHALLFVPARLGAPFFSMAILHFLIVLSAVAIFAAFAPFKTYQKILFIFGYFSIYEYNVIARSYSLSVLLLFAIAILYRSRLEKPLRYAGAIALLANTNLHSMIIAAVLTFFYIDGYFCRQGRLDKKICTALAIALLGFLVAGLQMWPAQDLNLNLDGPKILENASIDAGPLLSREMRVLRAPALAFVPIPGLGVHFWNTDIFDGMGAGVSLVGAVVFALSILALARRQLQPLLVYLLSCAGIMLIFFAIHGGGTRHYGLIFAVWIYAIWISRAASTAGADWKKAGTRSDYAELFLVVVLCAHVLAAGAAAYYEFNYQFSSANAVAGYLKENGLDGAGTAVATLMSYQGAPVLAHLPREYRFFCLEYGTYCSYMVWNEKFSGGTLDGVNKALGDFERASTGRRTLLLFSNPNYIEALNASDRYALVASFNGSIQNEDYWLYEKK